jgi:endoglucanase
MKRLHVLTLLCCVILLASACTTQSPAPQPDPTSTSPAPDPTESSTEPTHPPISPTPSMPAMPRLQVVGNKLVNEDGEIVILRGMGINDPILLDMERFSNEPEWNKDLFRELQDWGVTIVRFPIHPPNFIGNEEDAFEVLDQGIEWAGEYGMYVILDFHAFGFPPSGFLRKLCYESCLAATVADEIRFWQEISGHYAGNNTVAFYELFNEPASAPWDGLPEVKEEWLTWKNYNEMIIDLIRQNDPETIVLVAGLSFAKDQSFIPEFPVVRSNVAYAVHHNPTSPWQFGDVAERFPVVVTEVSFTLGLGGDESYSNESNYLGSEPYRYAITNSFDEYGVSWVVAAFAPSWGGFTMIEGPDFTPTETGLFWKDHLSSYNRQISTGEMIAGDEDIFSGAVGGWARIDPSDGSALRLNIFSKGSGVYRVQYLDDKVPLCGLRNNRIPKWGAEAAGTVEAFFQKLDVGPFYLSCDSGDGDVGGLYFDSLIYDPESDTLTDLHGSTWSRSD